MPFANREERLAYQARWREANRQKLREQARRYQRVRRRSGRSEEERERGRERDRMRLAWLREKKGTRCSACDGEFSPGKLDWHHLDPATKVFDIGKAMSHSRAAVEEEIAKCVVLCRGCHVVAHRGVDSEAVATKYRR